VIVLLVRHGSAGKRGEWRGDDRPRPLDERGRLQAERLVGQLEGREFTRVLSSPFARCVETVEPLARARGLPVESEDALAEGASTERALALVEDAEAPLVACVHGDLVEELLGRRERKGSTTVLDVENGTVTVLERLEPPA